MLQMYNEWIEAFEEGKISAVVMIDMSAAFDVVDHSILLKKLRIYGFEESIINWLSSYLENRKQSVFIDGNLSEPLSLEAGVPQGSILGPLLYVLFTNDLPEVIHEHDAPIETEDAPIETEDAPTETENNTKNEDQSNCKECGGICCYADDSTYTKSDKNPNVLKKEIDKKYKLMSNYMNNNKLVINSDKTHLLVMTSSKNHKNHGNYGITLNTGSEIIQPQDNEFLLGGIISNDLKWIQHIKNDKKSMLNQINRRLNALHKISFFSNFKVRKIIANGIIMSKLSYLIHLWGGTNEYLLDVLQILQNRAARSVTKLEWNSPIPILLNQCGWLNIRQLIHYHNSVQLFKIKYDKKPTYFHNKISNEFSYKTRLSSKGGLNINLNLQKQLAIDSFLNKSTTYWNLLPQKIRQSETLQSFKTQLKLHIKMSH